MARSAGISGVAVALAAGGAYLVFAGIRGVPPLEGLRTLLRGELPAGRPGGGRGGGGSTAGVPAAGGLGGQIATEAQRHIGVPYKWAGNTPAGWDCSGFVNYVLRRVGVDIPAGRPTTVTYRTWTGAVTIPRGQAAAGDLVWYPGHIGIAVDGRRMVHAPTAGQRTKIAPIYGVPTIRRVKG